MYKLELARLPVIDAGPRVDYVCAPPAGSASSAPASTFATLAPARVEADEAERAILSDYVLGREMPYPYLPELYVPTPLAPDTSAVTPLDFQQREQIRLWIAQGAEVRECGDCALPKPLSP
jgi:hypothetical protein